MSKCQNCGLNTSGYFMENKQVCVYCDDLLFDIEIECDEEPKLNARRLAEKRELTSKANTKTD